MNTIADPRIGDKVLILDGERHGFRGTIVELHEDTAMIKFEIGSAILPLNILQNFSAAARKAWETRPHRAAGRPKDPKRPSKRMVSLRLEVGLWNELGKAAKAGKIRSREAAVNEWLREKLDELWRKNDGAE